MGITAAHLRELATLGLSGECLFRVVEIIEEASARTGADKVMSGDARERRKEADRLRKRAARAAAKDNTDNADKSAADNADKSGGQVWTKGSPSPSLPSFPPHPPYNSPTPTPAKGHISRARGDDDWPDNPLEAFWLSYPPGRKIEKKAVAAKLAILRRSRVVTWERLMAGVRRYAASGVEEKYTKAPLVWLNRGCWDDEITRRSNAPSRGNGGPGFLELAMQLQQGKTDDEFNEDRLDGGEGAIIDGEFTRGDA